jgi:hypothetical protein
MTCVCALLGSKLREGDVNLLRLAAGLAALSRMLVLLPRYCLCGSCCASLQHGQTVVSRTCTPLLLCSASCRQQ